MASIASGSGMERREASGIVKIGTAGWAIPRNEAANFSEGGSGLARYSGVLGCTEINSTFYRSHRPSTFARWAASVPEDFRFSVKAPKAITHEGALAPATERLRAFLEEVGELGPKLGPILFQLPPKRGFEVLKATEFFDLFRKLYPRGSAVLEPRHPDWFAPQAEALLQEFRIGRVAADPALTPAAALPGGDGSVVYYRLHGAPRTYYSSYDSPWLQQLAAELLKAQNGSDVWCIFDNTAAGAAMANALALKELLPSPLQGVP